MSSSPTVRGQLHPRFEEILTPGALAFLGRLDGAFAGRRAELLAQRRDLSRRINTGTDLDFDPATQSVRDDASWQVAPAAPGLLDRRVELVSPVTRSMTQHAMESNASTWLADLEDATSPTWFNMIEGQVVLADAQPAGTRPQQTGQQVQQGGLARSGGPEQPDHLTGGDVQVHPGQRDHVVALEPVDVHQPVGRHVESGHRLTPLIGHPLIGHRP